MIELKDIHKDYAVEGRRLTVLNGINLQIESGKITVILGKSGCGKTTLLRVAGGLETPDSGEVKMGVDVKIGFVFQEARLMPWLNVWGNVRFSAGSQEREKLQRAIDKVGLTGFEKSYPHQLSGGMQQRTAIARAFVYEPSFIMMDEPFAALDYFTRMKMQREVLRIQKDCGMGILFVTHSIDEALLLGHKIIIIENGQMKTELNMEENHGMRNPMDSEFILQKKEILKQMNL